jgi:hypothetical protein
MTGVSTLATGSFLTFAAIIICGIAGIEYLERRLAASRIQIELGVLRVRRTDPCAAADAVIRAGDPT